MYAYNESKHDWQRLKSFMDLDHLHNALLDILKLINHKFAVSVGQVRIFAGKQMQESMGSLKCFKTHVFSPRSLCPAHKRAVL